MNTARFFASIRDTLFHPLSQSQVDGINSILQEWDGTAPNSDPRWVAYSLATTFHETATTMQPIAEIGKGKGHAYGVPSGPWHQTYYGRGDVQLTWERNYKLANDKLHALGILKPEDDLVKTPDLAMRPDVAAAIMIHGMIDGWFTGRKFSDFFRGSRSDWVDARTIINGKDKAALIAGYGMHFYHALQDGV